MLFWAILLPLGVFTLGVNKEVRFLTPLVPPVAALAAVLAGRACRGREWLGAALAAWMVLPVADYLSRTYGIPGPRTAAIRGQDLVVERIRLRAGDRAVAVGVGIDHVAFNADMLSAISARHGYRIRFTHLGFVRSPCRTL